MVGTLGVVVGVGLLVGAAVSGARANVRQRRAKQLWGPAERAGGGLVALAVVLGLVGWVCLGAVALPITQDLATDTVSGTAVTPAPGLIPAGAPATTSTKPAAPDPISLLKPGDCVEVPIVRSNDGNGKPTRRAGSPAPADCNTVDANYRVLQTGPGACVGNLYKLESSRHDKSGKLVYHLCLAFDWRVGFCYDTADIDEPTKVNCDTPGPNVVQVTAVLQDTTGGSGCPRDGQGAVWVAWDKRQMTVCFRGGDHPGR